MVSLTDANIYVARDLWFSDQSSAAATYGSISSWDTSQVTTMAYLFCGDESYNAQCNAGAAYWNDDISSWDTSSVTTMNSMFLGALTFDQTLNFNTSIVTDFTNMFRSAISFNQPVNFDTRRAVTLNGMFNNATSFDQPVTFQTGTVTDMYYMFASARAFNSAVNFDDTSNVWRMQIMFYAASSFNQPLNFDTSSVTTMQGMFFDASSFNQPLNFDTSSVTDMLTMFYGASSFNQPLNFNTSRVTTMQGMFLGASSFNQTVNFDTSSVTTMINMFNEASSFNQPLNFETSSVTNMQGMFLGASSFNQPVNFDTSSVTSMQTMFNGASSFNQPVNFDTSSVTNMQGMFSGASSFNQPVNIDTSSATNMQYMFASASSFDQRPIFNGITSGTALTGIFTNTHALSDCNKALIYSDLSFITTFASSHDWASLACPPPPLAPPPAPPTKPPSTPPSIPPPSSPAPIAQITGDPHVRGAHGDSFDFKGADGGIYVLLSAPHLSLAAQFKHQTFFTPFSKLWVHGSWIKRVYWTIRTASNNFLNATFDVDNPRFNGTHHSTRHEVEGVTFAFKSNSLTVTTPQWVTRATAHAGRPHPGLRRLHVSIQPRGAHARVAPHGLLGQTYDGDNMPLHGRRDSYSTLDDGTRTVARKAMGGEVTTRALGEGAIEGSHEMYRVAQPFETAFAFSRFDPSSATAPSRNVTQLRALQAVLQCKSNSSASCARNGPVMQRGAIRRQSLVG